MKKLLIVLMLCLICLGCEEKEILEYESITEESIATQQTQKTLNTVCMLYTTPEYPMENYLSSSITFGDIEIVAEDIAKMSKEELKDLMFFILFYKQLPLADWTEEANENLVLKFLPEWIIKKEKP